RHVIGDRAIVAAVLDTRPLPESDHPNGPDYALCKDVAELTPTNLVILFAPDEQGGYGSSYCTGPDFPEPTQTDDSADVFSTGLVAGAELAWTFNTTENDRTGEIEEYVLAYDGEAAEAYGEVPRRGPIPDSLATHQVVFAGVGMVAGSVTFFVLLRYWAVQRRRKRSAEQTRSTRRQRANARLNAVAERIRAGRAPGSDTVGYDAATARRYIDTGDRLDNIEDDAGFDALEQEIDELERGVS